jgi:signal transduction histidine kinase
MTFSAVLAPPRKPWLFLEALTLLLIIGFLDYLTAWELSLFVFYAAPIVLVAWHADRRTALLLAALCGWIWYLANIHSHPYATHEGYVWATLNRLVYFIFVAVGAVALRLQREETQARLESLTRTRELEREIVQATEREQIRIGQDLHDGLCQTLVAIDCAAACLKADLKARDLPEAQAAEDIQQMLQRSVIEARSLARGIFPVQMEAQGLATAIEELVETTNRFRRNGIICNVEGEVRIADPKVAMHLYRIAQEALSNALRHARAAKVFVRLSEADGILRLCIADDGCGMPPEGPAETDGMGLRTIRYRAQLIGAELEVIPNPTGGTMVNCSLPLSHARRS